MVTVVGNGLGDPGSNPERGCLHFNTFRKGMNLTILSPVMGK